MNFTWVPFYRELSQKVVAYQGKQKELAELLRAALVEQGMSIDWLLDRNAKNKPVLLAAIDPFTFFSAFNRGITKDNRIGILNVLKERLHVSAEVPSDFDGVPVVQNLNACFYPWEAERSPEDIPNLWKLAAIAVEQPPDKIPPTLFDACVHIKYVSLRKLTMGLFWVNPEHYLSLDGVMWDFLEDRPKVIQLGEANTQKGYVKVTAAVRNAFPGQNFWEVSMAAWKAKQEGKVPQGGTEKLEQPELDKGAPAYWTISPGEGAYLWERWQERGVISIGWPEIGDLSNYQSQAAIQEALKKEYPAAKTSQTNNSLACWNFVHGIKPGHIVIAKMGMSKLLGYGRVTSDYRVDSSLEEHPNVRDVEWLAVGEWQLASDERVAYKALTDVTHFEEWLNKIMSIMKPQAANYWWLNANPKIWRFADLTIGGRQTYTAVNEQGNKRQKYKYFLEAKPGDMIVGYMASPDKEVTSICRMTKALHETDEGPSIEFEKLREVRTPLNYETIKNHPDLKNAEPIINNQGSLFRLTKHQYEVIASLLDEANPPVAQPAKYTEQTALQDLFMERSRFLAMKAGLGFKKNIVVQGPPGVGKTFVARRLAYALLGEEDKTRVEMIQFHQSYSYEDFVQGYRPAPGGGFVRKNGVFYEFVRRCQRDPTARPYVIIIDEINRANLSKVFGEIMMLVEPDKRDESYSVPLTYSETADERFWIPGSLHLIGTMNTADRSLALVDFALRRRFVFFTLQPEFGDKFRKVVQSQGLPSGMIDKITQRVDALNQVIASEKDLGAGFQIGHSFFCTFTKGQDPDTWYRRVIELEIRPLLHEYWFESATKADDEAQKLLS